MCFVGSTYADAPLYTFEGPDSWRPQLEQHVIDTIERLSQRYSVTEAVRKKMGEYPAKIYVKPFRVARAGGVTSFDFVKGEVRCVQMQVIAPHATSACVGLTHELTHYVVAHVYAPGIPPRWLDEGLAMIEEEDRRDLNEDWKFYCETGRHRWGLSLPQVLKLEDYPKPSEAQRTFYAQSAAAALFLMRELKQQYRNTTQSAALSLLYLTKHAQKIGWDEAIAKFLPNLKTFSDTEIAYQKYMEQACKPRRP